MSNSKHRGAAVVLSVVVVLLASLAPWAPIETRSFAHLHPAVYWGCNAFLVALGVASLWTAWRLWCGDRRAHRATAVVASGFVLVYLLDLLAVFPTSPDPMPPLLLAIELVDTALALVVLGYALVQLAIARRGRPAGE